MAIMRSIHDEVAQKKRPPHMMLLEHEPVITITNQHRERSLKSTQEQMRADNIALILADRGGDATFHGPGQLVGYPIIPLRLLPSGEPNLLLHVRSIEAGLLKALGILGVEAQILPGFTGIWVENKDPDCDVKYKKLAAIGVGVKNGVSKHGFALNIDIDHALFCRHLIPCGLREFGVTTLSEVFLSQCLEMPKYLDIVELVSTCLASQFEMALSPHHF